MKKRKYSVTYSEDVYNFLRNEGSNYTIKQLVDILKNEYNKEVEPKKLAQYCIWAGIKYKYEKPNKAHSNKPTPIGVLIRKTDGGYLKVKVGNHKWKSLQRIVYENHYNTKLKEDDYVIFLDQNRRNFNIDNLALITRQQSAMLSKLGLYSYNPNSTKAGISVIKLMNKVKERENETNDNKKWWHNLWKKN